MEMTLAISGFTQAAGISGRDASTEMEIGGGVGLQHRRGFSRGCRSGPGGFDKRRIHVT